MKARTSLTVQEIGQFARLGLKPIIFVLNNNGYLIERLLCKDPAIAYNDLAPWRYAELPHAFGCDGWFTARVTTCGELDDAMTAASTRDNRCIYRSRDRCLRCVAACHETA